MVLNSKEGLTFSTFGILTNTGLVRHGGSTRVGGVSPNPFESLNLGYGRGDDIANVNENFKRLCEALDINPNDMVFCAQTHKANLRRVCASDRGKGYNKESDIRETDGLCTNDANVALVTFSADCVPILFLDPINRAIAAAHAGWRGTVARIASLMVKKMNEEFGSKPEDIVAGIGASIGQCCFEVDRPVAREFKEWNEYVSEAISPATQQVKYHVDLWGVNRAILISAGLMPEHIDSNALCTCCNPDLYFSHRRDKDARGSMASIILLLP
ncbi:MAG: peptidoglycan editing factor PgeF [Clostridiales bacterium]|jgi:YfiH family protein|nr:peptidoglycan editing factor PgeF [Clostridiales bacterium]